MWLDVEFLFLFINLSIFLDVGRPINLAPPSKRKKRKENGGYPTMMLRPYHLWETKKLFKLLKLFI